MGKQVVAGLNGGLAQLGEHLPCKQGVESSNLLVSSRKQSLLNFIMMYLENFTQNRYQKKRKFFQIIVQTNR